MKIRLTQKQEAYIRANAATMTAPDIAGHLGFEKGFVRRKMKELGVYPGKQVILALKSKKIIGRTSFTKAEDRYIKKHYLTMPLKTIGKNLGRSDTGIRSRLKAMGLVVPRQIAEKRKEMGQFKAGRVPANKGLRQTEFMSAKAIKRSAKTRFKKGNIPPNTKYDFAITVRTEKTGRNYQWIRIGVGKWVPVHRYMWEKVNGKIPKGMSLVFKDGDSMNVDLANLELLTRKQLMQRNTVHNLPKPIALTVQLRGALNRKINSKLKSLKHEK